MWYQVSSMDKETRDKVVLCLAETQEKLDGVGFEVQAVAETLEDAEAIKLLDELQQYIANTLENFGIATDNQAISRLAIDKTFERIYNRIWENSEK